jgi:hypothetical protein
MKVFSALVAAAFLICSPGQLPVSAGGLQTRGDSVAAQDQSSPPTETALRMFIAELQQGKPEYSRVETVLQPFIQQQAAASTMLLQRFGPLQKIKFVETENGSDTFKVDFLNGSTKWTIRLSNSGKIAELTLQPYHAGN